MWKEESHRYRFKFSEKKRNKSLPKDLYCKVQIDLHTLFDMSVKMPFNINVSSNEYALVNCIEIKCSIEHGKTCRYIM